MFLFASNGAFDEADKNFQHLYHENSVGNNSINEANVFYETDIWTCSSNDLIMEFWMEVWVVDKTASIENRTEDNLIPIFPNPNNGFFLKKFPKPLTGHIQIADFTGKIIYFENIKDKMEIEIILNTIPGIYFLQIYSEGKTSLSTEKIIVY
ncbi:MAG: T9SS type A sorting domain-containing protein [Bacteroidota bacterium]|nr:T9SS type A sorting domain-containing protein [Bacteroidota bacterium]